MTNVNYSKSGKSVTVDERALAVALCVPTQNLVLLTVWSQEDGGFGHNVDPIVAIRTQIADSYSIAGEFWRGGPLTHEELLDSGWHYDGRNIEEHPLVLDAEYGLISTRDDLLDTGNSCRRVILIPSDSDATVVIAAHVAGMQAEVQEKLKKREEKEKQAGQVAKA